ncbi:MAG: peptidoglycan bridge formation glycyltransferase FemA/FemB family protein [Paludibacter sp.]|nr:peptidoglycan bridge formation glycyltransferase FemA/FemB family protein [Paludibacter sp.]MDD4199326.1 peptidoglycan bridge formation glycyltransferase FemA/FemB family protein [Paludibacter sp.]MDD4427568.1 peptidoglycan bridge formation glycyltransferase FemA/FemB family protein [Paludibacter sp.]
MLSDVCSKEVDELYQTPIVQQTAFWSRVKNQLGASTIAVNFKSKRKKLFQNAISDDYIHSDVLVILQQINRYDCIAYVPYGPEIEPDEENQGIFLEEMSESLRSFLPLSCILIRYDLCWESYWAKDSSNFDENGNWFGEPEINAQELRFNFNTSKWNFQKAHFNILPSNTIFIDLKPDVQTVLKRMKPKTRYNIGLSFKKGVEVRTAGLESMDVWYQLYRETAERNNLFLNDIRYFKSILQAKAEDTSSPAEVHLLIAESDKIPLAAMFLIISGNRGSYLYGASASSNRNLMATYALQWEAMKISKEKGCIEYDMFGVAPNPDMAHPLYGLYKFKIGFGGNIYHSMGCWDYPLHTEKYNQFKAVELLSQGFHIN